MPLFTKHPVTVEAHQWHKNGDHPEDYAKPVRGIERGHPMVYSSQHQRLHDWEGQVVRRYRHPGVDGSTVCPSCGHAMHEHGWLGHTLEGKTVCPGDWVVTDAEGGHSPCKPDVFHATHTPAE